MGIDGLMSDQLFIEENSILITEILLQVQEEVIDSLYKLKGNKSAEEFTIFIQDLDVSQIVRAKSANAINIFEDSHGGMLQSIQGFAVLSEQTLQSLINYNKESLLSTLDNMGAIIKKEVIKGIISGSPIQTVVDSVRGQGSLSPAQLQTLVDTAMNEYSRSVTKLMMDEMPNNTKYQYIGALDEKTRPACLEMMAAGDLTKKEIEQLGIDLNLGHNVFISGGGYNCRHKWEIALQDKFGHDPKGAKKILNKDKN